MRDRGEARHLFLADGRVRPAELHLQAREAGGDVGDRRIEDEGWRARRPERKETAQEFLGRLSSSGVGAEHDAETVVRRLAVAAPRHRRAPAARARRRTGRRRPCAAASSAESSAWDRNPRPAPRSAHGSCWCRTPSPARCRGGPRERIAECVLGRSERGDDAEPSDDDPGGHARVRYHCVDEAATAPRRQRFCSCTIAAGFASLLLHAAAPAPPAPDLFDEIYARGRGIETSLKTVTARFTETTTSSLLSRPLVAQGTLAVERPSKIVLRYSEPGTADGADRSEHADARLAVARRPPADRHRGGAAADREILPRQVARRAAAELHHHRRGGRRPRRERGASRWCRPGSRFSRG